MKIIITAGGTGGHIYPALAIIDNLKKKYKDLEVLYIGTTDRMEATIIPAKGIKYEGIKITGLKRNLSPKNIKTLGLFISSLSKAKKIIKNYNPDIVIGTGGYITLPVIYTARKLGYKTLIHEQNIEPGLSNKLLSKYADKVCVSFEASKKHFPKTKTIYTGNPTSQNYQEANVLDKKEYDLNPNKKLILIVMGSLGSMSVTNKMIEILPKLKSDIYEVVYVTGDNYYDKVNKIKKPKNVKIMRHINNMGSFMKSTDIMVSRAGATTMAEIMTLQVPTIFIPSPYVTNNHQYKNAKVLEDDKCARILEEKDLSYKHLIENINYYINDENNKQCRHNLKKFQQKDSATFLTKQIIALKEGI